MKKLIRGIVDFRNKVRPDYQETFARLALGQKPDALFIACSDSRVAANVFASTDPGDLFVIRNVGNLIPPCGKAGISESDESEVAAIEFAILNLNVSDIIICGHSECGAMLAIVEGRQSLQAPHLKCWLRHGEAAHDKLKKGEHPDSGLAPHNQLSQLNVLQQLEHLRSYPLIADRIQQNKLRLNAWWFDIAKAEVYMYDNAQQRFVVIDESRIAEFDNARANNSP